MTTLNQAKFAAQLGVTKSYVTQLKQAGRLVLTDGLVDVEASLQLMEDTRTPDRAAVAERHAQERSAKPITAPATQPPPVPQLETTTESPVKTAPVYEFSPGDKAGSVYQQSRAIKEKYNAMAAKREYEISIGVLLIADEVSGVIANAATIVRTRIESLPDILAPQFAAERDEQKIRALWIDYNESMLTEMCRQFQKLIGQKV